MKKLLGILCFALLSLGLHAQVDSTWIRIENHWYGPRFFQNEKPINLSDLIDISEGNARVNEIFRKANNRHDFARFCQAAGSFLILYPIVNQAIGRDPNWTMVYIGTGLWGLSIPIELKARHLAEQGTLLYNQRKHANTVELRFDPAQLKVTLKF